MYMYICKIKHHNTCTLIILAPHMPPYPHKLLISCVAHIDLHWGSHVITLCPQVGGVPAPSPFSLHWSGPAVWGAAKEDRMVERRLHVDGRHHEALPLLLTAFQQGTCTYVDSNTTKLSLMYALCHVVVMCLSCDLLGGLWPPFSGGLSLWVTWP